MAGNPYVLYGNVGLDIQKALDDSMLKIKTLAVQEQARREDNFVKMMNVQTVNMIKDNSQREQLKKVQELNDIMAKDAAASNYNFSPNQIVKFNGMKRDLMQWQQQVLQWQQAYAHDRDILANDKNNTFDIDEGMDVLNQWDGTTPYTPGQALIPMPKNVTTLVNTFLDKNYKFSETISHIKENSDGSAVKYTSSFRGGLYDVDPKSGVAALNPDKVGSAVDQLMQDKDVAYAVSYLFNKAYKGYYLSALGDKTDAASKQKAEAQAQQEILSSYKADNIDDAKRNMLLGFLTPSIKPIEHVDALRARKEGSGMSFVFGGGGIGFGNLFQNKFVDASGNESTDDALQLQKGTVHVPVSAELFKFDDKKGALDGNLKTLGVKFITVTGTGRKIDTSVEPADNSYRANYLWGAGNFAAKKVKGSDGKTVTKYYKFGDEKEVQQTIPVTQDLLNAMGPVVVATYKKAFAGNPNNVFNTKASNQSKGKSKWEANVISEDQLNQLSQ